MKRRIVSAIVAALLAACSAFRSFAEGWRLEGAIRFSPRAYHGAAVLGDRLFVACGMRMGMTETMTNDVWASRDGDSWERLAADPPFPPRRDPSLVAFAGKLWLVGGKDGGFRADEERPWFRDIWTSADGKDWEEVDAAFLPPGTERLLAVADAGRLLIVAQGAGGVSVFSSRDGRVFEDRMAKGLPEADSGYAWAGAFHLYNGNSNAIYRSEDGTSWTRFAGPDRGFLGKPAPLAAGAVTRLYAICGDGFRVSADGISWEPTKDGSGVPGLLKHLRAAESASYGETVREGAALAGFRGSLWVVAGALGSRSSSPGASLGLFSLEDELWESGDGKEWKRHPGPDADSGPEPRYGQAAAVHEGKLFLLGGATDPAHDRLLADAWAMGPDGRWERRTASAPWDARFQAAAASFRGRIWLLGGLASAFGEAESFRADVWSSADGVSWRLETDKAAFGPRAGHALVEHGGRLWVIGGEGPDPSDPEATMTRSDIYVSGDGLRWEKADPDPAPRPAFRQAAASAAGRILIAGGMFREEGSSFATRTAWSTGDGVSWRREGSLESFTTGAAGAGVGGAFLVVGGIFDGSLVPGVSVMDGEGRWSRMERGGVPDPGYLGALAVLGDRLWYWAGLDDSDGPPSGALWSIPLSEVGP